MLRFFGGTPSITLDKLTSSIKGHWQIYGTETFFKVKDVEMVYISQSDLGTFQLIFKEDNSTNNA